MKYLIYFITFSLITVYFTDYNEKITTSYIKWVIYGKIVLNFTLFIFFIGFFKFLHYRIKNHYKFNDFKKYVPKLKKED